MIGKVTGGLIGFSVFGPLGALAGVILGHLFDAGTKSFSGSRTSARGYQSNQSDFAVSFVALTAIVLRADGRVMRSELNYVKDFVKQQFGAEQMPAVLDLLKQALKKNYNTTEVCREIRSYMDISSRSQLVYYLLGVANADNDIAQSEEQVIQQIAQLLGLPRTTYMSLRAMFSGGSQRTTGGNRNSNYRNTRTSSISNDYKILGIGKSADDDEVKKAFRSLAKQFHPDKLSHLSQSHQKAGKEKFVQVQEAYDRIKESRGMK